MPFPVNIAPEANPMLCGKCRVHNRTICTSADEKSLHQLNRISHIRKCHAGETILAEGDEAKLVGNVVSGVLKVSKILSDGREQIVGLLFPTDFFGRAYVDTAQFSIEAATDAKICTIERHAFESLIEQCQLLEHQLLIATLSELDAAREWMVLLGCQNTLEKVASFFLMLTRRADKHCRADIPYKDGVVVVFPINRSDIVAYLGTTVETLSRQIQYLSRHGVIRVLDSKHFEILNEDKLAELAGKCRSTVDMVEY